MLGPLLFLIFVNDLPNIEPNAKFTLFADDTTISTSADSIADAIADSGRLQERAKL